MTDFQKDDRCDDAADILEAEEEFMRALTSLDVNLIMSHWSDTNEVSLLFPGTEAVSGHEAVRDAWELVARNTRHINLMLKPISAMQCENIGWTFLSGTVMTTHGDETLSVEVFVTNIYRLEDGDWKLVHLHSTPSPYQ